MSTPPASSRGRLETAAGVLTAALGGAEVRPISGGLLMQQRDLVDAVVRDQDGTVTGGDDAAHWRLVAGDPADESTLADLQFAWRAVRARLQPRGTKRPEPAVPVSASPFHASAPRT